MKLSKNGRKIQMAIHRAIMLGLPVAELLVTTGCGKELSESKRKDTSASIQEENSIQEEKTARQAKPLPVMGAITDPGFKKFKGCD